MDGIEVDVLGEYRERSGHGWVDPFVSSRKPKTVEVDVCGYL